MRRELLVAVLTVTAAGDALAQAATDPSTTTSAVAQAALESGQAPMDLTGPDGQPLADALQMTTDGVNEKYRIAEDSTNVAISEHSVAYNTQALAAAAGAGATVGQPNVQWSLTNNDTGEVQNAGQGGTEYSGVIKTPGLYNLGNSGITDVTPPDNATVVANGATGQNQTPGTIQTGTDVELEVTDITAPAVLVAIIPEDSHVRNEVSIVEDPANKDAYPITKKTAQLAVTGANWSPAAAPLDLKFTAPAGMVRPEDEPKVNDSKLNPDVKAHNEYTIAQTLNTGLQEGFFVPVSVRCNFEIAIPADNEPRQSLRDKQKKTWKLEVVEDGVTQEVAEPPAYIFRKPNFPAVTGSPTYTLVAEGQDGSGNSVVCRVPILVLPQGYKVTDLDRDGQRQ
jgi:hypothetical protein